MDLSKLRLAHGLFMEISLCVKYVRGKRKLQWPILKSKPKSNLKNKFVLLPFSPAIFTFILFYFFQFT